MWKLPASERLAHWRAFRKELDSLPLESALDATVEFWQRCPFIPFYLDNTSTKNWPDPWKLIEENSDYLEEK